jgi:hypothetical protein
VTAVLARRSALAWSDERLRSDSCDLYDAHGDDGAPEQKHRVHQVPEALVHGGSKSGGVVDQGNRHHPREGDDLPIATIHHARVMVMQRNAIARTRRWSRLLRFVSMRLAV